MPTQIVLIPVGAVGADFTGQTAAIDAWLDGHKAQYVIRYIAGGGSWKHLTPEEAAHHHKRGIAIVLNFEGSKLDYLGGALHGRLNGINARNTAQHLGYPAGLPLIVTIDTGLTTAQLPLAQAYVEAFFTAIPPYRPAYYGPINLFHRLFKSTPFLWLPNAADWRIGLKPTDVVHVRQQHALYPPDIDPDITVTPFEAWLPRPDSIPPSFNLIGVLMAEAVLYVYIDPANTAWIGNGLARMHIEDEAVLEHYVAQSVIGGGPKLLTGQGVEVKSVDQIQHVQPITIEALGKAIN